MKPLIAFCDYRQSLIRKRIVYTAQTGSEHSRDSSTVERMGI